MRALPDGLRSYPAVLAKGVILRSLLLEPVQPLPLDAGLPEALEALIRKPPSVNEWVSAVSLCALHAACYDLAFADAGGVADFEEWTFERTLRLMQTPLYRRLMTADGPEHLLALHGMRWSAFYRGASLDVLDVAPRRVVFRLSSPPHCWPTISRIALGAGFRAAAVTAGAKSATVMMEEDSPRSSRFDVRWR
jgi:hypothetical protein